jgi:hypothetical protein
MFMEGEEWGKLSEQDKIVSICVKMSQEGGDERGPYMQSGGIRSIRVRGWLVGREKRPFSG